jgi:hypothetical protein
MRHLHPGEVAYHAPEMIDWRAFSHRLIGIMDVAASAAPQSDVTKAYQRALLDFGMTGSQLILGSQQ